MKVVNLYDLKQMGNKGGCTIQLIHHFPFGMGLGHLKKDYIEFKRVGIFDGKAVEVYQKIRHYKMEQRMPQSPWVERIVQVLDLDYEDLFRR
ncbi:Tn5253 bacteriocine putative [Streptococcus pneumoniae]|uniref:hypothetical protein n=1 Tax=Streptococcus pneumoniae TaxID=1313 RepID=UPI0005E9C093|nr:hypothetical protein [Streptococcus pneumoniae]CKF52494.1 Tn5253 bacteriocine putative [Streptococcus pneumoniae]